MGNGIYPGGSQVLLQTPRRCGQRGHGQGRASNIGGKPGNRICPGPSHGANTLGTSIHKPQRPVSLSLKPAAVGHIEGVPIETPSNGILSFDAIMESRTGLTPTSILTPIKTTSNLNTPTCGSQHKSSLIFTPLFSPNTEATLLTSL